MQQEETEDSGRYGGGSARQKIIFELLVVGFPGARGSLQIGRHRRRRQGAKGAKGQDHQGGEQGREQGLGYRVSPWAKKTCARQAGGCGRQGSGAGGPTRVSGGQGGALGVGGCYSCYLCYSVPQYHCMPVVRIRGPTPAAAPGREKPGRLRAGRLRLYAAAALVPIAFTLSSAGGRNSPLSILDRYAGLTPIIFAMSRRVSPLASCSWRTSVPKLMGVGIMPSRARPREGCEPGARGALTPRTGRPIDRPSGRRRDVSPAPLKPALGGCYSRDRRKRTSLFTYTYVYLSLKVGAK